MADSVKEPYLCVLAALTSPYSPFFHIMQRATITGIRIRSPADARIIFHAVFLTILPMVTRRLDTEERSLITTGSVYVWEERGPQAELTGVNIKFIGPLIERALTLGCRWELNGGLMVSIIICTICANKHRLMKV